MHEHLFCDLRRAVDLPDNQDERALALAPITLDTLAWVSMNAMRHPGNLVLDDEDVAVREVELFSRHGGQTIVDVTTADFGRDPDRLLRVSERTGIHVVMGCGHYHEMFHRPGLAEISIERIASGDGRRYRERHR